MESRNPVLSCPYTAAPRPLPALESGPPCRNDGEGSHRWSAVIHPLAAAGFALLLLGAAPAAQANTFAASMACMQAGVMDTNPRLLGRTPGGLPVYVCRNMLSNPPYPVVACRNSFPMQCRELHLLMALTRCFKS